MTKNLQCHIAALFKPHVRLLVNFRQILKKPSKTHIRPMFLEFVLADQAKPGQASQHEKFDRDQKIEHFREPLAAVRNCWEVGCGVEKEHRYYFGIVRCLESLDRYF